MNEGLVWGLLGPTAALFCIEKKDRASSSMISSLLKGSDSKRTGLIFSGGGTRKIR